MGFLVLLFTALFALQFAEARVLDTHFHSAALLQHNSAVTFNSDLDAVASSRQNYSGPGEYVANYSESDPGSSSENSTHASNDKVIPVELLPKETTPGHDSSPGVGHMSVNGGIERNILSSGQSPGVGHWKKSKAKTKYSTSPPSNMLLSGPSPGVGNAHTTAVGSTQLHSGTFNKLPSGSSPGVHSGTFNKLPSGSSPGAGHKVTNGYIEIAQESKSKKSVIMNKLPSGPSPGGGNSATNRRNTMEIKIITEKHDDGTGIQTFNRLPSGSSPGVGHSSTNAHVPENIKITSASEDRKGSDHIPIFHKLPGGPSPGGGHSSTVGMQLSSSPSPGDGNSSMNKLKPAGGSREKKVERTAGALDRKIGCAAARMDPLSDKSQFFEESNIYGTPTPPMFGIADGRDSGISKL